MRSPAPLAWTMCGLQGVVDDAAVGLGGGVGAAQVVAQAEVEVSRSLTFSRLDEEPTPACGGRRGRRSASRVGEPGSRAASRPERCRCRRAEADLALLLTAQPPDGSKHAERSSGGLYDGLPRWSDIGEEGLRLWPGRAAVARNSTSRCRPADARAPWSLPAEVEVGMTMSRPLQSRRRRRAPQLEMACGCSSGEAKPLRSVGLKVCVSVDSSWRVRRSPRRRRSRRWSPAGHVSGVLRSCRQVRGLMVVERPVTSRE